MATLQDLMGGGIPAGLLDPQQEQALQERAKSQGLLNLGFALLQASQGQPGQGRPRLGQIIGQAGPAFAQGYRGAFDETLQNIVRGQQLQDMQRKRAAETARQAALKKLRPTLSEQDQLLFEAAPSEFITQQIQSQFREPKAAPGDVGVYESAIQRGVIPPDTTFEQFLTMKNPPGATVNVLPAETERQKGYGKFGVERNQAIFNAGQQAVQNIPKIDNTLNLLKEGDPRTGFGSEFLKNIDRVRAAFSGRNIQSISDTELLNSLLGADVFPQIGALGIGARGLDTPAEREFLREVMTGTIAMDKNTLIRLTELRKKYEKKSLDTYNEAVDSGQLDELFQFSGLPKRKLSVGRNIEVDF